MEPSSISQIGLPMLLGAGIVGIIINALVLMYAANYMDIPDADFGKCFITSLVTMIVNAIASVPLRNAAFSGRSFIISFAISAIISTIFIKYILNTEWGRAFLTYIVMLVVTIIIFFALGLCCAGGACFLMPRP